MADTPVGFRKLCERWNIAWHSHELTFSCHQRRPFLSRNLPRQFLVESIAQARLKHRFHLWAYVIMPKHVHLLVWPGRECYNISAMLTSIKQPVSRGAVNWLKKNNPSGLSAIATGQKDKPYTFWMEGSGYDRNIRTRKTLEEVFAYIHNNPFKRGLVARPEDWPWSSAQDWAGIRTGPIPLDKHSFLNGL